jgi:hypothetical protein
VPLARGRVASPRLARSHSSRSAACPSRAGAWRLRASGAARGMGPKPPVGGNPPPPVPRSAPRWYPNARWASRSGWRRSVQGFGRGDPAEGRSEGGACPSRAGAWRLFLVLVIPPLAPPRAPRARARGVSGLGGDGLGRGDPAEDCRGSGDLPLARGRVGCQARRGIRGKKRSKPVAVLP